jgi:hypothetical protein
MRAFWNTASCILIEVDELFRGTYCLRRQGDETIRRTIPEDCHVHNESEKLGLWSFLLTSLLSSVSYCPFSFTHNFFSYVTFFLHPAVSFWVDIFSTEFFISNCLSHASLP